MRAIEKSKITLRKLATILAQSRPDFIIICAQKAGTTALFNVLNQHYELKGSKVKEVGYFNNDEWLDYNSPMISMTKQPFADRIDSGYSRTSGVSGSGYGIIGKVEFIVIDDLSSVRLGDSTTTITITIIVTIVIIIKITTIATITIIIFFIILLAISIRHPHQPIFTHSHSLHGRHSKTIRDGVL